MCEHQINECAFLPCRNNAQCEDLVDGYRCHCMPGWFGMHCDYPVRACAHMPCRNNASCMDLNPLVQTAPTMGLEDTYVCRCNPGMLKY